ncbi:MazG-like family [Mycobacteroides abscessus subsp. bolletii]|nr:MazG-like family [Mycobacteroides abscessus subsp. bolletii]
MDNKINEDLRKFVEERNWDQFHTLENLAKSISIESGELLECFQWGQPVDSADIQHELADVLTYAFLMCQRLGVSPETIISQKLEITKAKYPIEKSYGSNTKYNRT